MLMVVGQASWSHGFLSDRIQPPVTLVTLGVASALSLTFHTPAHPALPPHAAGHSRGSISAWIVWEASEAVGQITTLLLQDRI